MGVRRGTQWAASPPGPGGNALRPPRGPGRGLFDPSLKFLLRPRSCVAELHLSEPRAATLGLIVPSSRARDLPARGRLGELGFLSNPQPQFPAWPISIRCDSPCRFKNQNYKVVLAKLLRGKGAKTLGFVCYWSKSRFCSCGNAFAESRQTHSQLPTISRFWKRDVPPPPLK